MYINVYRRIFNNGLVSSSNLLKIKINRSYQVNSDTPEKWNVINVINVVVELRDITHEMILMI